MIAVAKRSPAYRAIRSRVTVLHPSDSWYEDGLAFILFTLRPASAAPDGEDAGSAQAIFVVSPVSTELLAARLVEMPGAGEALVRDLLAPADALPGPSPARPLP